MGKFIKMFKENPLRTIFLMGIVAWILFIVYGAVTAFLPKGGVMNIWGYAFFGAIIVVPFSLSFGEIAAFVMALKRKPFNPMVAYIYDLFTVVIGTFYELSYMSILCDVVFVDWNEQLYNTEKHCPINLEMLPTIIVLVVIAMAGYTIWTFKPLKNTPPLVSVFCIGAVYMGPILEIVFTIQYYKKLEDIPMLVVPICVVLMCTRTILVKVREWESYEISREKIDKNVFLKVCNDLLYNAKTWPLLGLVAMLPVLGVIIGILVLFGQAPDAVIKAWTETADWALSQKVGPQNIMMDEHYLCTVAAGGHRKVVKPQRYGMRHGHRVIVNRQLCIANAFEQVLEERTPKFHKRVRHFYDTYGFPIAKLIKTKTAADIVYFIMKPLEWIFLIVIYLTDVKPENRIAVQYMGTVK